MEKISKNPPDVVLGYIHPAWKKSILAFYGKKIYVYNFAAQGEEGESIEVDYAAWAGEIWKRTKLRIQQPHLTPICHLFPTT